MVTYRIVCTPHFDTAGSWSVRVVRDDGTHSSMVRLAPTDSAFLPELLDDARKAIVRDLIGRRPESPAPG